MRADVATLEDLLAFIALKLRCKTVEPDAAMGKTRGWDSMAQVDLVLSLEEKYGVRVPPDMFGELSSVPAILDFLNREAAA
jgi:acyl carrier protein